ncbi:TIGR03668 family PPOX class F420-dependent oxidoreductase [Microbispora cellulosiformans]|uniref:TIGR03668 family PPOX class F420-dependent oxidoreductase n=1 Tax=Microbispora cellulosiformans TaxID=2614688 RepID=A0A5J5JRM8_9ACTN|nr:TIGR03668 family PPOX class F420-dependent oxidoreductase [Microbispora cellulosiformans]KAA9373720.1 TIGR03668 family PPOX class F420-dependent oxidoreductase [Microbispora cellulosiformans]
MPEGRARELFAAARVARLATAGAEGAPRLVPVTFATAYASEVTGSRDVVVTAVDHKPKSTADLRRLRDIRDDPRVCLLADHYEEDWERLWWVRADGRARVVESGPARDRAVAWLAAKYAQYRERPPAGPAILVEIDRWSGWSYAG